MNPFLKTNGKVVKNINRFSSGVTRFIDKFGIEDVKIIIFEEFIENPKKTVQEILKFLNVDYVIDKFEPKIYNSAENPIGDKTRPNNSEKFVKPKLFDKDKQILIEYYRNDVKANVLDKDSHCLLKILNSFLKIMYLECLKMQFYVTQHAKKFLRSHPCFNVIIK